MKKKIGVIGTGNWGTALARLIAKNISKENLQEYFDNTLYLWGIEEKYKDELLSTIINLKHVNKKYLDGVDLPHNITCTSDISVFTDIDIIIIALPHQFIRTLESFRNIIRKECIAVSVIKGFIDNPDGSITQISTYIKETLGCRVNVLMGANIANDVARDDIAEATLGYVDAESKEILYKVINSYYFRITCVRDIPGVELMGSLKNIVSLGYGLVEGLGYSGNTRVAILRNGLLEIKRFLKEFYPESRDETIFQSCGIADLIVSSLEGRNYKYGKAKGSDNTSVEDFEKTIGGQKIQGTGTAEAIYKFLKYKNRVRDFPLFTAIYMIFIENSDPSEILRCISTHSLEDLYN